MVSLVLAPDSEDFKSFFELVLIGSSTFDTVSASSLSKPS